MVTCAIDTSVFSDEFNFIRKINKYISIEIITTRCTSKNCYENIIQNVDKPNILCFIKTYNDMVGSLNKPWVKPI